MTTDQANEIADNCSASVEVREGYSGRGMYGKECVALVVENPLDLVAIGFTAGEIGMDPGDLPRRIDSMGSGLVIY